MACQGSFGTNPKVELVMDKPVRVLFSWEFAGPHHLARVRSCRPDAGIQARIFALSDCSTTYNFYQSEAAHPDLTVAYRSVTVESLPWWQRLQAYIRHVWLANEDAYFLCHYERPEVFLTSIVLRLRMKKVFVMNDSKFDDYERHVFREATKAVFYLPYHGALVSGKRSESYLRFLGVRGNIETGYDTIDVKQIGRTSNKSAADLAHRSFFIVVNRLVKRKNTAMVMEAFAAFCAQNGNAIDLVIVGEGPEEQALRGLADRLGISDRVKFMGVVRNEEIASLIARSIALLLMSSSEQWGLVVNEAIACGVPVIVSDAVGARDALVRNFVNGFVVEGDNPEGLVRALSAVWREGGNLRPPENIVQAAATDRFADAVRKLLGRA